MARILYKTIVENTVTNFPKFFWFKNFWNLGNQTISTFIHGTVLVSASQKYSNQDKHDKISPPLPPPQLKLLGSLFVRIFGVLKLKLCELSGHIIFNKLKS